jgi:hypothetical protein
MENENWTETQLEKLASQTQNYTKKEKAKAGYNYLKSALQIVPVKIADDTELHELKTQLEGIIDAMPPKKDEEKLDFESYSSMLSSFKKELKQKHNMVSKGTYTNQWIVFGMPLGLLLGFLIDNIALGLPMGLTLGLVIGSSIENKAKKENRVIG